MVITVKAKVDGDVKNALCQTMSHYRAVLCDFGALLQPYLSSIGQHDLIRVGEGFFVIVKKYCDNLNDILGKASELIEDPRLPDNKDLVRKILPWYDSCGSWVHDSRGFIQKIYPIVRNYQGENMHARDLHSVYALQDALMAMEADVWGEIMGVDGKRHEMITCDLYKLFDKFRLCYREDEDQFKWGPKGRWYKTVRCANGFGAVPLNLYANALKYLPPGPLEKRIITLSYDEDDSMTVVSISSVGPFVPEEQIASLWEIGIRAESANIASTEGSGRGLPRVKKLCDDSGFGVWIKSEHRTEDEDGWGLFTVFISIPKESYEITSSTDE